MEPGPPEPDALAGRIYPDLGQDPDPRPTRTLEEIQDAMASGSAVLTEAEQTIYFKAKRKQKAAKTEAETEAEKRFWVMFSKVTTSLPFRLLDLYGYLLYSLIPLAGVVIGIMYFGSEHCPAEPSIAPVMIGLGITAIIIGLSSWIEGRRKTVVLGPSAGAETDEEAGIQLELASASATSLNPDPDPPSTVVKELETGCIFSCISVIIKLCHFILFIIACVIVYRLHPVVQYEKKEFGDNEEFYCNQTLYLFAFWCLTSAFIVVGIALVSLLVAGCCYCACVPE